MIVATEGFRDSECFTPKQILENRGHEVKIASNKEGIAKGADGGTINVDMLVQEINPEDFDAVVFVGGPGALENLDNKDSYKVAQATVVADKLLAAICISPVILAKAEVLKGKKATVWSSEVNQVPAETLLEHGAIHTGAPVTVDGKIITANGPAVATEFGEKIAEMLS